MPRIDQFKERLDSATQYLIKGYEAEPYLFGLIPSSYKLDDNGVSVELFNKVTKDIVTINSSSPNHKNKAPDMWMPKSDYNIIRSGYLKMKDNDYRDLFNRINRLDGQIKNGKYYVILSPNNDFKSCLVISTVKWLCRANVARKKVLAPVIPYKKYVADDNYVYVAAIVKKEFDYKTCYNVSTAMIDALVSSLKLEWLEIKQDHKIAW